MEDGNVTGDKSKLEMVMRMVYKYALEGKPWAVQFIADRMEGKAQQNINVTERTPHTFIFNPPEHMQAYLDECMQDDD